MYPGERKPPFYLLTGIVIGIVLGVIFGWIVIPVQPVDLAPNSLRDDFKDEYRELISFAYLSNGDIGRARSRLDLLGDENHARILEILAQEAMGQFAQEHIARALGLLAENLKITADSTPVFHLTEQSQTDDISTSTSEQTDTAEGTSTQEIIDSFTETPTATSTGIFLPTSTTNPTKIPTDQLDATEEPDRTYLVIEQIMICDVINLLPKLEVYVFSDGKQIPWVEIEVRWTAGTDYLYTGLKPDIGLGYADFEMSQHVFYDLKISENSETLEQIGWAECEDSDGTMYWGGWEIHFSLQ